MANASAARNPNSTSRDGSRKSLEASHILRSTACSSRRKFVLDWNHNIYFILHYGGYDITYHEECADGTPCEYTYLTPYDGNRTFTCLEDRSSFYFASDGSGQYNDGNGYRQDIAPNQFRWSAPRDINYQRRARAMQARVVLQNFGLSLV